MIGAHTPIPVDNDEGEYSVRVKTTGENQLEGNVTEAIYRLSHTMNAVLCELQLLNARIEVAFETTVNRDDIEEC